MKLLAKTITIFLVMLGALCAVTYGVFSVMVAVHTATTGGTFIIPLASLGCGMGIAFFCGSVVNHLMKRW